MRELNLSENLLWRWSDLAEVGGELGNLRALNVSRNRLSDAPDPRLLGRAFAGLRSLVLNDLDYEWGDLLQAARGLPQLECLHLADNRITEVGKLMQMPTYVPVY